VLVVEDEDPLRSAVLKMLRKRGVEVLEAANGSAAIDLLRANRGKIDVILLDMTIPGASSREVVAEAVQTSPDAKVVLTSAYSASASERLAGIGRLDTDKIKASRLSEVHLRVAKAYWVRRASICFESRP